MPISPLEATVFNSRSNNRWTRCPSCVVDPYQLCDPCTARYCADVETEVCAGCATVNAGLAAHPQQHSGVLELCVDSGVCELVEALTRFGAPTVASCSGSPEIALGRPYVGLKDLESLHAVISVAFAAAVSDDDTARDARVLGLPTVPAACRWTLSLVPTVRSGSIELVPHLDLPGEDLAWLVDVLAHSAGGSAPTRQT